jgi:hypothetical protein
MKSAIGGSISPHDEPSTSRWAGSGLVFEDEGEHELKGVAYGWHLNPVVGQTA